MTEETLTKAVALATLGLDSRLDDENRRRAFADLEKLASQGTMQAEEGGLVSIDEDEVLRWEENMSALAGWPPMRIYEVLKNAPKAEEWALRARLVWAVIVTVEKPGLEAFLQRR